MIKSCPKNDSNLFLFLGVDISGIFKGSHSLSDILSFDIWYP